MDSSVTEVYDIVAKLDKFILTNSTSTKIGIRVYRTYQTLLKKRSFMKVAALVNTTKMKYLKHSMSTSKLALKEKEYYESHLHTIVNVLVDSLLAFVSVNETDAQDPEKFFSDRWQSLHEYWINSNKNCSLDIPWIVSSFETSSSRHPENFKLVYKMFVLCCVVRWELLRLPRQNFSHLPQFTSLYSQINNIKLM